MKYDFAALRFVDDENIKDRLYWYLADFPVREGDEVLAPVGIHDRLQKAVVERVCSADAEGAPYDVRQIKEIAARVGARKITADRSACFEFGGVRYDNRHYTRLGCLLYTASLPQDMAEIKCYGVDTVCENPSAEDDSIYRALLAGRGVLLVGGEGREIFRLLLSLVKGEESAKNALRCLGFYEGEIETLRERLA